MRSGPLNKQSALLYEEQKYLVYKPVFVVIMFQLLNHREYTINTVGGIVSIDGGSDF